MVSKGCEVFLAGIGGEEIDWAGNHGRAHWPRREQSRVAKCGVFRNAVNRELRFPLEGKIELLTLEENSHGKTNESASVDHALPRYAGWASRERG